MNQSNQNSRSLFETLILAVKVSAQNNVKCIYYTYIVLNDVVARHCMVDDPFTGSGVNLVWNLGGRGSAPTKISIFQGKFPRNFDFSGNFKKNSIFSRQIFEIFRFFQANFQKISIFFGQFKKKFDIPGKNFSFTTRPTSGQINLFLFKSHHFRTYVLYMISYNNISRPVNEPPRTPCDPTTPLSKIWGRDPQPPGLTLLPVSTIVHSVNARNRHQSLPQLIAKQSDDDQIF